MNNPIKILFINYSLNIGGIESLILQLCKRIDRNKYNPMVCVFEPEGAIIKEFESIKIPVYTIDKKEGTDLILPIRIAKLIRKKDISIVHTHNSCAWLYGGVAAAMKRVPLVHTQHTTADYFNYHTFRWEKIEWFLSQITNSITTVADSVAKYMIEKEHINRNKISVVYNGILPDIYTIDIDSIEKRKELGIKNGEFVIGNVARLTLNKDHQTLLEAFRIVSKKMANTRLVIVGDGPERSHLEHIAESIGIKEKVIFLGQRRDVAEILNTFDLFALSSIREGFPIAVLEAMAASLPVIATDVDGNKELVKDGETGLVVKAKEPKDMAEAIIKLIQNKEIANAMGKKGFKRINDYFTLDKTIKEYEKIYEGLVDKNHE